MRERTKNHRKASLKNLKDDRENGDYGIFSILEKDDAQKAIK
jgi:hypothetical protein